MNKKLIDAYKTIFDFSEIEFDFYMSDNIWHYTSAGGLKEIINKDGIKFWFTRSDCLNDVSEGNNIINIYKEAVDELYSKDKINKEFYSLIKKGMPDNKRFVFYPGEVDEKNNELKERECEAYICCFSKQSDDLSMWRYYSKGEDGYGILLNKNIFKEKQLKFLMNNMNSNNNEYSNISIVKVIYEDEEKKKILKEKIQSCYIIWNNIENKINRNQWAKNSMQYILTQLRFCFKHECFKNENELRAIYYIPTEKKDRKNYPEIKFRNGPSMIIPYIEIDKLPKHALIEIMISPFIKSSVAEQTLKTFISENGYRASISRSKLPVR